MYRNGHFKYRYFWNRQELKKFRKCVSTKIWRIILSCSKKTSENVLLYFTESFVPRIYTLKRLNTHWDWLFFCCFTWKPRHLHAEHKTEHSFPHRLYFCYTCWCTSKVMALRILGNFNFFMSFQLSQHNKISKSSSIVRREKSLDL